MLVELVAEGQVVENTKGDTPESKLPVQLIAGTSTEEREGLLPSVPFPHMLSDLGVLLLLLIT